MTRRKRAAAPAPAVVAMRLLGAWNRIAQGHVALALGCSCGVGISSVRAADFEQDILEFLCTRHGAAWRSASIGGLLARIARDNDAAAGPLLADLESSIQSFEQQHSGR